MGKMETIFTITDIKHDLILIQNKNQEVLFKIDYGNLKKVEDEKEIAIVFAIVCSDLAGIPLANKDELLTKIITNYRNGKIDNLLK
jgi:hypothetical protein